MKAKQYKGFFSSEHDKNDKNEPKTVLVNLRTLIESIDKLSAQEKRQLFDLHNDAVNEEIYGQKLMQQCEEHFKNAKFRRETKKLIYILSIDWPFEFKL